MKSLSLKGRLEVPMVIRVADIIPEALHGPHQFMAIGKRCDSISL